MSIFESERIWEKMFALSHTSRDKKTLLEAIACLDCAVWDLIGKALGKSVRELLGGYRDRLQVISIGGYYMEGKTLADIGREMELLSRCRHGGLQVQGRRPRARGRREARRSRAQSGGRRLRAHGRRQPRLERSRRDRVLAPRRALRHPLVRRAVPLVRRCGDDGAGAPARRAFRSRPGNPKSRARRCAVSSMPARWIS